MTANRSLDEFADDSSGAAERGDDADDAAIEGAAEAAADESTAQLPKAVEDATDDAAEDAYRPDPDDVPEDVTPLPSTYAWSPGGGACAACGDTVEERWREGDDLVCADCKDW